MNQDPESLLPSSTISPHLTACPQAAAGFWSHARPGASARGPFLLSAGEQAGLTWLDWRWHRGILSAKINCFSACTLQDSAVRPPPLTASIMYKAPWLSGALCPSDFPSKNVQVNFLWLSKGSMNRKPGRKMIGLYMLLLRGRKKCVVSSRPSISMCNRTTTNLLLPGLFLSVGRKLGN